jgi:RNA polymerase sigma factor (sigma-70 family)
MSFPQTQLTLIQRLAAGGTEDDWRGFLKDYWGPICRFSLRFGARNLDEAEDVASKTFEVLWEERLLVRWASNRSAKLRTLLCTVVRNVLSHQNRVRASREERQQDLAEHLDRLNRPPDKHVDAFYVAWVEDLVQQAVKSLAAGYCRKGQVDYVRVLYGRLCQGMTIAQVAESLGISNAMVDHYFRDAKQRLGEILEQLARRQSSSYCSPNEAEQEFVTEWQRLGQYLAEHGGIEEAVRQAYALVDPVQAEKQKDASLAKAVTRLTTVIRSSSGANPFRETN